VRGIQAGEARAHHQYIHIHILLQCRALGLLGDAAGGIPAGRIVLVGFKHGLLLGLIVCGQVVLRFSC
jgi:hypothetical protein